jgi:predicted adenylyl cyclase CyaB
VARNVEVKRRVDDLAALRPRVIALGARSVWRREQIDRYYELDGVRRLKLRTWPGGAELIRYDRPETRGVRPSDYEITRVRDGEAGACLVPKGSPLVTVRKRRELLLLDNVRFHLDDVDDLGTFLEIEAVLDDDHDQATCEASVRGIMEALGLQERDLVRASYGEMLLLFRRE